jgi:preprotein translocase subunit SecB
LTTLISIEKKLKDKKELEKIILIKLPTEIYPALYATFVYLFSQAGIQDVTIKKDVDFEKLYNEKNKS